MKTLLGFISVIFFFAMGSPVKWAPQAKPYIAGLESLAVVQPVVDIEEFPSGKPFQSSYEQVLTVSEIKESLDDALRFRYTLDDSSEISRSMNPEFQKQIVAIFDQLRQASDVTTVALSDDLAEVLQDDVCYLFVYYQGYSRSGDSMTEGYHSAAFQTESVPRAYARDIDYFNSNKRSVFKSLPKRYGATVMIALIQGTGEVLYFAIAQNNDNPTLGATVGKLIGTSLKPIREIKKQNPSPATI
jgi:AAA+ ATPase superfamily predicted ATPase